MSENGRRGTLHPLRRLRPYLRRYRRPMLFGIFCVMASNGMAVVAPWIVKDAINALKAGVSRSYAPYAWGILGATALSAVFLFLMRRIMIGVSRDIEYELRNDLYSHMQVLSASYYDHMYTGDLMSRSNNDLSAVRMVLGPAIMYSVNTFFTFVSTLTMMGILNGRLTLLALFPLPFVSWMVTRYGKVIHARFKEVQEQFSHLSTCVQENLSGIKVVKAFGREQREVEQFRLQNLTYVNLNRRLIQVWGVLYPMVEALAGMGILIVLWYGGRDVILGKLTLGAFVAFIAYLSRLIWPAIALGWVVNITQRGAASMARINEILDERPAVADPPVPAVPEGFRIRGKIEFREVTFGYREGVPVLRNMSFLIPAGKTVSFVGATGSGKSSLLQLIPRAYDPESGEILIDDLPLRSYPLHVLRSQIGVVPQDAFLFSETIRENIGFGLEEPEEKKVRQAAQRAFFETEVLSFPNRYETFVGERGITLSGGQKQRATLARALALEPAILLLDDSFSNVDTFTEDQILKELRSFRRGRTCLIVSHRISTIQDSDWIYVIEGGAVAEEGTHTMLLESGGLYYDLYQKQLIEEELHLRR